MKDSMCVCLARWPLPTTSWQRLQNITVSGILTSMTPGAARRETLDEAAVGAAGINDSTAISDILSNAHADRKNASTLSHKTLQRVSCGCDGYGGEKR